MHRPCSKNFLLFLAIVLPGFVVAFYFRTIGFRDSFDSGWYLLIAEKFSQGGLDRNARYAPLYSWSLGLIRMTGLAYINVQFVYLGIIFSGLMWLGHRFFKSYFLALVFFSSIFFNVLNCYVFNSIWTEAGYALFLVGTALFLLEITSSSRSSDLFFLIFLSLLPLQRYIGGYLAVYLGLIYIFSKWNKSVFWRGCLVFIAALPTLSMVIWNYKISAEIGGSGREGATLSFSQNIDLLISVLAKQFFLETILYFFVCAVALRMFFEKKIRPAYFLVLLTPWVQLFVQVYISSTYKFDKMNYRFVSAVIPLMNLVTLTFLIRLAQPIWQKKSLQRAIKIGFVVAAIAVVTFNFIVHQEQIKKLKFNSEAYYADIRKQISLISVDSQISIHSIKARKTTSWVLFPRILPENVCRNYSVTSFWTDDHIRYAPACKGLGGPRFVAVDSPDDSEIQKSHFLIIALPSDSEDIYWDAWDGKVSGFELIAQHDNIFLLRKIKS